MKEIWKPLQYKDLDLRDKFAISNMGRLKNLKTDRVLKSNINHEGYLQTVVYPNGAKEKCKAIRIHIAVAYNFVEGYKDGLTVNHIDGNRLNNAAENLEWVTMSQNMQHAYDNGLTSNNKIVKCIETGVIFDSIRDARKWCGLKGHSSIHSFFAGKTKTAGKHPETGEPLTWVLLDKEELKTSA